MRLTFFHHSLIVGSGIDTGIYELARRIGRHHAVTVLTFASDYDSLAPAELRILPTSIVPRSRAGVVGALDPAARRVARDFLRTQDVVNIHTYPANLIAYRVQGPRHVATEWGAVDASLFPRASEQAYIRVATWAEKRYCRSADLVVCPCAFTARWTSAHFQVSPAVTLLDGINFEVFDRSRVDPRIILERFPSLRPGPVLLTVGRITPSKNLETLVEAFAIVRRQYPTAVLLVTGKVSSPGYDLSLRSLVRRLGLESAVTFTGRVSWDDLARLYASCDVFVVTSLWEGFLRAEAFAMGKPMVAFDVAANPDTISDEVNGVLVRERTAEAFSKAVLRLLADKELARRMGDAGYRWARENLDFDRIATRFAELIDGGGPR